MGIDCSTGTILNLKNVRINNLGFNSANVFEYILNAPKIYVDSSRIYGNHDMVYRNQNIVKRNFSEYFDTTAGKNLPLMPNLTFNEAIVLEFGE